MSKLTLEDAISHCLEVAEQNETSAITYKNCKEIKTNMYEKLTAEKAENDCRECAAEHRQLAEWLTELKEAKRLLKAAVPIINNTFPETGSCWGCANHDEAKDECKGGAFEECSEVCKWEHADEALKLIGGTDDV